MVCSTRLLSIAFFLIVGCTPAAFAHRTDVLEACRTAHTAETNEEERRALIDELLQQANLQLLLRVLTSADIERWLSHPPSARYATEMVTTELEIRTGKALFDVAFQGYSFEMSDASTASGPTFLAILDVPSMPHERRVLTQGRQWTDATKTIEAILGHAATGGVGIMAWWAFGGKTSDLIPKGETRREPPLTSSETLDIQQWAANRINPMHFERHAIRLRSAWTRL